MENKIRCFPYKRLLHVVPAPANGRLSARDLGRTPGGDVHAPFRSSPTASPRGTLWAPSAPAAPPSTAVIPGTAPHACAPRPAHPAPLTSLRPAEPRVRSMSRTRPRARPQRLRVTPRSRPQARLPFPPAPCAPARARRHTRAAVAFTWNAGSKSLARRLPARAPPPGRPPHRLPCRRQGRLSPTRSRPHQCWDTVAA